MIVIAASEILRYAQDDRGECGRDSLVESYSLTYNVASQPNIRTVCGDEGEVVAERQPGSGASKESASPICAAQPGRSGAAAAR